MAINVAPPNVGPEPGNFAAAAKTAFQALFPPEPNQDESQTPDDHPADGTPEPDPYDLTDQQLVQLFEDTKSMCEPGREIFEYGWWRNLLYFLNRHWIYWNPTSRQFQDKRLAKWVPKPVTNLIRRTVLIVRAAMQALDLSVTVRPNGAKPANILTAQTVDDLEPAIQEEHKITECFQESDFTTALFGDAFLHAYWDTSDPSNTAITQLWRCSVCQNIADDGQVTAAGQKCPTCGSQMLLEAGETSVPIGAGKTLVATPLELLIPLYVQNFNDCDRLIYMTWRPEHQVREEYSDLKAGDGKPLLDKLAFGKAGPQQRSLQLYKAIATTSDLTLSPSTWGTTTFTGQVNGCSEFHLWIKPCKTYPKGFYCRFVGDSAVQPVRLVDDQGQPLDFSIPYTRKRDGAPIWPWVKHAYEPMKGRLYSQSAVDSIIQKNDQINQIDSSMQMSFQRMGNPIWLEQKGAAVERFTGEPGIVVRWQAVGNGGKPERIDGIPPSSGAMAMREMLWNDAEKLTGTSDAFQGQKPSGVEAYAALNLLKEQSQSSFTTTFSARAKAYRDWFEIALELERSYGPTARTRAVMGPNKAWTFQTFQKADLTGDVSILMEDGSNVPKTALAKRAALEHGRALGVVNAAQPDTASAILTELGITNLAPALDADAKSALAEQQAFEDWVASGRTTPCPLVVEPWHNDALHLTFNRQWMNGDAVRQILAGLQPQDAMMVRGILQQHLQEHAIKVQPPPEIPKVVVNIEPSKDLDPTQPWYAAAVKLAGVQTVAAPGTGTPQTGGPPGPGGTPSNAPNAQGPAGAAAGPANSARAAGVTPSGPPTTPQPAVR
jgi:DNA-directed RNA polymerase subunit RPC12/RpoP